MLIYGLTMKGSIFYLSLLLTVLAFVQKGNALECYQYHFNTFDGLSDLSGSSLQKCEANATVCSTMSWSTNLEHAGQVNFHEGLCTTMPVCQRFCMALNRDDYMKRVSNNCQQYCCSEDGCNSPLVPYKKL